MSGTHYVGAIGDNSVLGSPDQRYFYALRTDEDGNIYFTRIDTWTSNDPIEINNPGDANDDWEYFELGVDFFDGKNPETHVKDYPNLVHDQYRFDRRSLYYYINDEGELVVRYNQSYSYPSDV
jgi:hypothetical protein